jgi:hypothetical protein
MDSDKTLPTLPKANKKENAGKELYEIGIRCHN